MRSASCVSYTCSEPKYTIRIIDPPRLLRTKTNKLVKDTWQRVPAASPSPSHTCHQLQSMIAESQ